MAGRKDHKPTETQRSLCVALKSCGVQHETIARIVGVSAPSLRKWYAAELQDGLACAVAGAATNMFRLALKQSSTGFMAASHVLRCFGGPAWKDTANINLNPGADAMAYLTESASADIRARILARINSINGPPDSDNAREIIAGKLAQLAARNGRSPDSREVDKEPAEGE